MKDIKEFTIKRSEWLRGEMDESYLLRASDRKRCCIGFYLSACGIDDIDLLAKRSPHDLSSIMGKHWLLHKHTNGEIHDSDKCSNLIISNDAETFTQKQREQQIVEIFAEQGIEASFVD